MTVPHPAITDKNFLSYLSHDFYTFRSLALTVFGSDENISTIYI